jgi:anti-sigma regulatory factor (Ser/Thr protein kinase)
MPSASIMLVNRRDEISRLSQFVEEFGAAHHLVTDEALDVNLVLDEVVINIISHAYNDEHQHHIEVSLDLEGRLLTMRVEDDGRRFDPLAVPPPNLNLPIEERPLGGLGIHIVRSLTDTIEYRRHHDRNILTLKKTLTA